MKNWPLLLFFELKIVGFQDMFPPIKKKNKVSAKWVRKFLFIQKNPVFQQGTDFHLGEAWTITSKGTIRKRKALQDRDICTPKVRRFQEIRKFVKVSLFLILCDSFKFIESLENKIH